MSKVRYYYFKSMQKLSKYANYYLDELKFYVL